MQKETERLLIKCIQLSVMNIVFADDAVRVGKWNANTKNNWKGERTGFKALSKRKLFQFSFQFLLLSLCVILFRFAHSFPSLIFFKDVLWENMIEFRFQMFFSLLFRWRYCIQMEKNEKRNGRMGHKHVHQCI